MLEKSLERVGIPAESVDHVSMLLIEEITQRECLNPAEKTLTNLSESLEPNPDNNIVLD